MRKSIELTTVSLLVAGVLRASAAAEPAAAPDLDTVLDRLADVATLYRDEALQFTCREKIVYTSKREKVSQDFEYIYVFDPREGLLDYRIDPRDRKREIVHGGLERPYSWIFVFEESKHDMYTYELVGSDRVLGRRALKIRFDPVPPFALGINDFEGVAWVDAESWQLLRVEAEKVQAVRRYLDQEYTERFKTEFGVVKNGMRFPSRVGIRRANFGLRGRPGTADFQASAVYRVSQNYSDYRFFGVRSRAEIEQRRRGDREPDR